MTIPPAAFVLAISQYVHQAVAEATRSMENPIKQASSIDANSSVKMNVSAAIVDACVVLIVTYVVMHIVLFVFQRRHQQRTFERMKIPGPKPHIISGHLYESRREPYVHFAEKLHEKYGKNVGTFLGGDPFLITKDLDLIQQVFVAKSRLFYDRMNFYMNVEPVPDNLICQRGDRWRYMRKLLTPAFTNQKIRSSQFYRDTQKTVDKLKAQLEANKQPGSNTTVVHDVYDRMAAVALDVIVKTAFHMDDVISFRGRLDNVQKSASASLSAQFAKLIVFPSYLIDLTTYTAIRLQSVLRGSKHSDDQYSSKHAQTVMENADFLSVVKTACRLAFNPLVEMIFCFPFLDAPLTFVCSHLYFGSIYSFLLGRLDHLVRRASRPAANEATKQIDSNRIDNDRDDGTIQGSTYDSQRKHTNHQQRRRIVDSLVEVLRERKITRTEFIGNAFVIVFAGFETTANALTFTLWLLAHNQRVQTKLRKELMSIKSNKQVTLADNQETSGNNSCNQGIVEDRLDLELAELATECNYLEAVINESLRLYPPVPSLSCRQASTSCTLSSGMHIEKGVNVIPSVYSIHRDKAIWGQQADEFIPERFELMDLNQINSAMFMPFGLGPRNCIGKAAAMHELKIVVGRLIKEYLIEPARGLTPDKLKLCSPINITITNSETIGLKFVKL